MEPGNKSSAEAMHEGQPMSPQYESLQGYAVPERSPEVGPMYRPETGQQHAPRQEMAPPPPPTGPGHLPVIAPPVTDDSQATATAPTDDTPLVAADEDLIEKEWVDKAKKIIADTKDDPYRREQEIKKLQIDYVRKRYGRVIGDSGE